MQIFSSLLAIDLLPMALNPGRNTPFFRAEHVENTYVIIFGDLDEGPFFNQWTAFAKTPLARVRDCRPGPHFP